MTSNYKRIIDIAEQGSVDPTSFIRPALDAVNASMEDGFNIVTPNSPFLNLIEASGSMTHAAFINSNINTRKQYRRLAQTYEDLYGHLSDNDFKGRFGNPGKADIHLILSHQWILDNAVAEPSTGDNCIYIPKDTSITVNDISFYFHHDIKIHVMASGGIQVYFVINRESPIYTPTSLMLESREVYQESQKLIDITIPTEQLSFEVMSSPVTANGFNISLPIIDDFYYARAFIKIGGVWSEVPTTHSQETYDSNITTMVLKVTDRMVEAYIPNIYINSGNAGTEAMVIVYSTKGDINTDLSRYQVSDYRIEYNDIFDENLELWEMLSGNPVAIIASNDRITDGTDALTFEEMKDKVVYNNYGKNISVTYDELVVAMNLRGYGIYKQKDTISERVFIATKELPKPETGFVSSSAAVTNKDVLIDVSRNDINNHIVTNGDIVTVKPKGLFKSTGFDVVMANDQESASLRALGSYDLCDKLNEEQWFYTPFYYVLDTSTSVFRTSAYYLDKPTVITTSFVNFNPNLDYAVKTRTASISFDGSQYILSINASLPQNLTDVHLQLRLVDENGGVYHLNATQEILTPTESRFNFVIETNLAINSQHRFYTSSLRNNLGNLDGVWIDMVREIEFIYLIEDSVVTPSTFDSVIETIGFNNPVSGVTYDKITFKFGEVLDKLNVLSKNYLMPGEVLRHNTDVPKVWEKDNYLHDSEGRVYTIDTDTGDVIFTITHNAGDVVLDSEGNPEYIHRVGDPVITDNQLTYTIPPYNARKVRLFLIDAKYLFADDVEALEYSDELPSHIVRSLDDIADYDPDMLERTDLLFEPVGTANLTVVDVSGGRQTSAFTSVKFDVRYTMSEARYSDIQLRNSIIETTKKTIAEQINQKEFSLSELIRRLDRISDTYLRNVDVNTSLPDKVVRTTDDSSTFSVRTRIIPASNGQLSIEDDINVEIVR